MTAVNVWWRTCIPALLAAAIVLAHAAAPPAPAAQTAAQARAKSLGCMSCHAATDRHTMHQNPGVVLGCTDCHGGDASVVATAEARDMPHDAKAPAFKSQGFALPAYPPTIPGAPPPETTGPGAPTLDMSVPPVIVKP